MERFGNQDGGRSRLQQERIASEMKGRRRIAVIGGGINGLMTSWALNAQGNSVDLFERGAVMSETSRTSTKLLHGGLRYLEQGNIRLVRESLRERTWWLQQAPSLVKPLELILPIYSDPSRTRWKVGIGLTLYDWLAGRHTLGRHRWYSRDASHAQASELRQDGLRGAYGFFDAQMDDHALGLWVAEQVKERGVTIHERTPVHYIRQDGTLATDQGEHRYDAVVNVAGPWAHELLERSAIPTDYALDLVRGSHLELRGTLSAGFFLQVPGEQRIVFALPYHGHILLGTTEVEQTLHAPIVCSDAEERYLLDVYNYYFTASKHSSDIIGRFAGLRPLLHSNQSATKASREYAIERRGNVITVFGGKWTTSRVLGEKVAAMVQRA